MKNEKIMQPEHVAELIAMLPEDVQEKILCTIQGAMMVQPPAEPA